MHKVFSSSFADWVCEGIFILTTSIHSWFLPGGAHYENTVCAQLVPLATLPCHSQCQFGEVQGDLCPPLNNHSTFGTPVIVIYMHIKLISTFLIATSCRATSPTDTSYVRDPDSSAGSDDLHCEGTETYQPNSE